MVEGGISELIKWWIYMLLLFGALALFMFIFQVGQTNRFSSFVAAEIERGGVQVVGKVVTTDSDTKILQDLGFTPEAEERIRQENATNYDGRYTVTLNNEIDADTVLSYGDLVDYEVTGLYEILFSWFSAPILKSKDQAIIQVRMAGSDGEQLFAKSVFDYEDFEYQDTDGVSILASFSETGLLKYYDLVNQDQMIDFVAPDRNPYSNITVTHIADDAFTGLTFMGDFIAPNVKVIGKGAFRDNPEFNGKFNAPNVLKVGDYAFQDALFTGDFEAGSLTDIGTRAFRDSLFNGEFKAPQVVNVGVDSFISSTFEGSFNAPNVKNIGSNAFRSSKFEGYFNAPGIETIGNNAFTNSRFLNGKVEGNAFVIQ